MHTDRYGLELTTDSAEATDAWNRGFDALLASRGGVGSAMHEAITADPGFALPHIVLCRAHQTMGRRPEALEAAEHAVKLAADATEREREAAAIQLLLTSGRTAEGLDRIRAHVKAHPLDALTLAPASSVFGLIGFSGRIDRESEQLALLEPLAEHYGDDWWFLAVHAFALVETGRWEEGTEMVRRSLDLNPASAHASHILAHALYEGGRNPEALDYLDQWMPGYVDDRDGYLHCHLSWHHCLLLLGDGQMDRAWSVYDDQCAPDVSIGSPLNVLSDGASLHWRAELAGFETSPTRWSNLSQYYDERFGAPGAFLDAHAGLALVALGRDDEFEHYLADLDRAEADGRLPAGPVAGIMNRAFRSFARSDWSAVIDTLGPHLDQVVRIGGSRAQRDLAWNTVLAAYARDGRWAEAESMLATVTDRRPIHPVGQP